MINVSKSFKNAIKSDNREIHGYVEIKYQDNDYELEVDTIPTLASVVLSDGSGLLSNKKIMNKYATLEENYTLLDGSFMVWNTNVIDRTGIITEDIFENIEDSTIIVSNDSIDIPVKGITIYFKDNLPFDFEITIKDTDNNDHTYNVTNNTSLAYQQIFDTDMYISQIELHISNVEFIKNRMRIANIDFNISDFYEGDELIGFDVNENFDILVESLPINTCTVRINNYPTTYGGNKFDPINPKGITQYLTDNVTIEPYIGVLTEDNGIEYVKMGMFYLTDWNANNDGNVTFNGSSILNKLKGKEMIWNSGMFSNNVTTANLATMIENTANVKCSFPEYSMPLDNWSNSHTKLFDYLSYISPCLLYNDRPNLSTPEFRKIYVNRYNNIVIDNISNDSVDNIDRSLLLEDVEYITNRPIKNVIANYTVESSSYNTTTQTIINTTYTLTKNVEYLWFKTDKYIAYVNNMQGNVTLGYATLTYIGNNSHMVHAKVEGVVGSVITITCSAEVPTSSKNNNMVSYVDNSVNDGDTVTLNFGECEIPNFYSIQSVFFDLDKPYNVKAKTMGDPSLEIGDTISIQTRYNNTHDGYKDIIITKQSFTFDGGLQCSIEGLGE